MTGERIKFESVKRDGRNLKCQLLRISRLRLACSSVVNSKYALSAGGSEMLCVENSHLAGIAPKSNVSISRATGGLDAYELFVDSARTLTVLPARTLFAAC